MVHYPCDLAEVTETQLFGPWSFCLKTKRCHNNNAPGIRQLSVHNGHKELANQFSAYFLVKDDA